MVGVGNSAGNRCEIRYIMDLEASNFICCEIIEMCCIITFLTTKNAKCITLWAHHFLLHYWKIITLSAFIKSFITLCSVITL